MLKIQQEPMILNEDRRPYPMCVDEDGTIGQQSHFKYVKATVFIGFQASMAKQQIDLWRADWFKDPQKAVGMYPVTGDGEGGMGVHESVVESVEEIPDRRAADIP